MRRMTREQAYERAAASSQPTTWVIRQPSGNYYIANVARQTDGVAVAVRRGRGAEVVPVLPMAWR